MNFNLPTNLMEYLDRLDTFIEREILPLQDEKDHQRFFDHRREHARTDWDEEGLPRKDWEDLLAECVRRADEAGFYRFSLPREYGGCLDSDQSPNPSLEYIQRRESATGNEVGVSSEDGIEFDETTRSNGDGRVDVNLWMAVIRRHLAKKGLGLFNDLQSEHSVVGNFPDIFMLHHFGSLDQRKDLIHGRLQGRVRITFGLTEPDHGSDATFMTTRAVLQSPRDGQSGKRVRRDRSDDGNRVDDPDEGEQTWVINGKKMWQTGMHKATHCFVFARTSGRDGSAQGITCFIVPRDTPGVTVESYEWTLNMPTDHATVSFVDVRVPSSAILGRLDHGLAVAQAFVHENRIRQAASSLGAAEYCISESIAYARRRRPFGKPLSHHQAIQFPLVELSTQAEMLRLLIFETAHTMDHLPQNEVESRVGMKISMCNYWANRLCTEAADRAIQVHGGWGYSRHFPFEHIWRHHRRYRITEGSEEIQMRKVAGHLFGFIGDRKEAKL